MDKKKIILILLVGIFFISFFFISFVSSEGEKGVKSIVNIERSNDYDNITYSDGSGKMILYSANHRNVLRNGIYIPREEVAELFPDEYYFEKIQDDGVHDIKVIKYNWTSAEIKPFVKDNKELNKDIPIKINGIEKQKVNLKSLDNSLDSSIILNFENKISDYNISFGETSTTITFTSNNTGKEYEDTNLRGYSTELNINYGATTILSSYGASRNDTMLFRMNRLYEIMNPILATNTITNATWLFRESSSAGATINTSCFLMKANWTEGDIDGGAGVPNHNYNYSDPSEPWGDWESSFRSVLGGELLVENMMFSPDEVQVSQNLSLSAMTTWANDPNGYGFFCMEYSTGTPDKGIYSSESVGNEWLLEIEYNLIPVINNAGVNQSIFNEGMYIWANVTDIDNNILFVNFTYTLPNGTIINLFNATSNDDNIWNSTRFIPDDGGNFSILVESGDEFNDNTSFISSFVIDDTVSPTVVITYPKNNTDYYTSDIPLNFSLNDDKSQNANLNCWYEIDESGANTSISNCENFTLVLSFGGHNLTLYANDSFGNIGNSGYYNFSALNDTSSPSINLTDILDLTSGDSLCTNKNVTFTYSITDNNILGSCWLNVYDGISEKVGNSSSPNPIDCNGNESSFIVSGCSAYTMNLYANDTYSNENSVSDNFTLSYSTSQVTTSGEGGSTPEEETIKCDVGDVHWEIKPRSYDTFLGKKSYRERTIEITNNGTEELNFNLNCDDTSVTNFTKNSCQFVNISAQSIKVKPNIKQPEKITVRITTPEEASFYDSFSFGIFFTDNQACSGTVSFVNKVTIVSGSFYKISQIRYIGGLPIPIALPFLLTLGIFTFIGVLGRKIFFFLPLMMLLGAGLGFLILIFI